MSGDSWGPVDLEPFLNGDAPEPATRRRWFREALSRPDGRCSSRAEPTHDPDTCEQCRRHHAVLRMLREMPGIAISDEHPPPVLTLPCPLDSGLFGSLPADCCEYELFPTGEARWQCCCGRSAELHEEAVLRWTPQQPLPKCGKYGSPGHDAQACPRCIAARRAAREAADADADGVHNLPEMIQLADLLAEPDEESEYRIDGLLPAGGTVVFSAPYKSGKTTMRNNLIRALVDGEPFLGRFEVAQRVESVAVLDLEMPRNLLRRWFRDQGIARPGAVSIFPMRGQGHTLNVFDQRWRDLWAERLSGFDVVILDCLDPVINALSLDPNNQGRKLLEEWGAVLTLAGVSEVVVIHHHGHGGERAKGDSGILGWPDVFWDLLLEEPGNPSSRRYFKAYGRDVEVEEGLLEFDPATRHLTYLAGGSRVVGRKVTQASTGVDALVEGLRADHDRRVADGESSPPSGMSVRWMSKGAVEVIGQKAGLSRDQTRAAITSAEGEGLLLKHEGGRSHAQTFALSPDGMARGIARRERA